MADICMDTVTTMAKESASEHLDGFQDDMRAKEDFVMIRGAKVRNSMNQSFISNLENDRHIENFLSFLDN